MGLYQKFLRSYDDFCRKYFSLTQDSWEVYTKFYPFVVNHVMGHFNHPFLGPRLRRLFRFEGKGHHAEACIVPIGQDLQFSSPNKNVLLPLEKLRFTCDDSPQTLWNRLFGPPEQHFVIHHKETERDARSYRFSVDRKKLKTIISLINT